MNDNMYTGAISESWFAINERQAQVESGFDSIMHDVLNIGTALGLKTEVWVNPANLH